MCCTLGDKKRKCCQGLAHDVFRNLFHQGNSLLSLTEGNKGIYQRYVGLLHQCSVGLHLGGGAALCDRIVADGTYNSLCYWLHGVLTHACQLLLPWHASQCPDCQYLLSPGWVVRKKALFLPWDTLSSCSARAPREHCWLLPVIAYTWQSQRLPRLQSPNHVWWGFAFFFPPSFLSVFSFCLQTVKHTDLYQFNTARKAKAEEEGGQREEKRKAGEGAGWVRCVLTHERRACSDSLIRQRWGTGSLSNSSS